MSAPSERESPSFDRLVEYGLDVVMALDASGAVRYTNPAIARVLGYAPAEVVGHPLVDFIHPEDAERVTRFIASSVDSEGGAPAIEMRFQHREAGWRRLEVIGTNLLENPDVGALVLNARDITGWEVSRRALAEAEQRYRTYVEENCDGIWRVEFQPPVSTSITVDEQIDQWYDCGRLAECNPAYARMLQREDAGVLIGSHLAELLPRDVPESGALLREFAASGYRLANVSTPDRVGEPATGVLRTSLYGVVEHDALVRVWGVSRLVPTPTPSPTGAEHGVTYVGEQGARTRLRDVLAQVPAIVWTTDSELRFTSGMGAGLHAAGLEPDELAGVPIADYFGAADQQAAVLERHRAALRGESWSDEIEWSGRVFSVHLEPLSGAKGRILGTVGVAIDITDLRRHHEQERQTQKMNAIGQLTGGIAHDFNNLLTVIMTNSELLAGALPADLPDAASDLAEIRAAAQRGSEVIRKLLGFGRRDMLALRPLRLAEALEDSAPGLRQLLPDTVTLQIDAVDPELVVHADPAAFDQILTNLVTNARDAMPTGGTITVGAQSVATAGHAQAVAEITVRDTGEGMTAEVLDRAFEPFFTTRAPGAGSGLGLAMIYGLVTQHGGTVELQSAPDEGTTAAVRLPLMYSGVVVSANGAAPVSLEVNGGGAGTVLVAEDEPAIRKAARRLLERYGYDVIEASDGAEALERFQACERDVDLIICDVVMPRLGGREVLDALRRKGKSVPFLLMSGHSGRGGVAADALEPGIPFLAKPWTAAQLLGHVRQLIAEDRT